MQAIRLMQRAIMVLLALTVAAEVNACSCIAGITVEQQFEHSDAVFAGVVVAIDDPCDRVRELPEHERLAAENIPPHLDPERGLTVTFRVLQWWKTDAFAESIVLRTGYGGGDCGYPVEEGKSYLVYASRGPRNEFGFSICGRTTALLCASADIAELGEPIKTYEMFDLPSLIEREQPYTTSWRSCIKPPVLTGDRGLKMNKHCRFTVSGVIGVDGAVRDFGIISRTNPRLCPDSLDKQIHERVAQWRFLPARFEGKAIETALTVLSTHEPINESEYAQQLKEASERAAKRQMQ